MRLPTDTASVMMGIVTLLRVQVGLDTWSISPTFSLVSVGKCVFSKRRCALVLECAKWVTVQLGKCFHFHPFAFNSLPVPSLVMMAVCGCSCVWLTGAKGSSTAASTRSLAHRAVSGLPASVFRHIVGYLWL